MAILNGLITLKTLLLGVIFDIKIITCVVAGFKYQVFQNIFGKKKKKKLSHLEKEKLNKGLFTHTQN